MAVDRLKQFMKEDNFYSYMLMLTSTFTLFCSTILIIDGYQCHCGVGDYEDPIPVVRTCKRCAEVELARKPGEQINCEPGLSFGAVIGSIGVFFGIMLAALWRDSIDTEMLTQKHENEIDISTATAAIEVRNEDRGKLARGGGGLDVKGKLEKQGTTSSYYDDDSMMDMDY